MHFPHCTFARFVLISITTSLFILRVAGFCFSQVSFIETAQKVSQSLVTIEAHVRGLVQSQQAAAGIDPQTGRLIIARNAKAISHNRTGAGIILDRNGILVTNAHIVRGANSIKIILNDGQEESASIKKIIPGEDLAFLKIDSPGQLKPITFADSDQIHLRDEIFTIGHSPLLNNTISGGKIIGLGVRSHNSAIELFQINMNLYKGDSGGPLLDRQGRLIGLMVAGQMQTDQSSFAIPANKIKKEYHKIVNER